MPYVELEQFLDRGAIKAYAWFSWKTAGGLGGGAIVGMQLGALLYGTGTLGVGVLTLLGAASGLALLSQRRGLIVARRLGVRAAFWLRRAAGRTELDGRDFGVAREDATLPLLLVRVHPPDADAAASEEAVA
jgi:hypothetical protein